MINSGKSTSLITLALIIVCTALVSSFLTRGMASSVSDAALEKALTDFIVKNPTIIGNAVKQAYEIEQRQEEEKAAVNIKARKDELHNDTASPFVGNKNGSKVLVEFFDYNCGYCKKMLPDINALLAADKDLKIVLKEIPILGDMSIYASKISLAVYAMNPDKYWEVHTALLNDGARSSEQVAAIIKKAGFNFDEVSRKAESAEILAQLDKHVALAQDIGVRGTPAFVANTTLIRGAQGKDALTAALNAAE